MSDMYQQAFLAGARFALQELLQQLAGCEATTRENHENARDCWAETEPCWENWHSKDIRSMVESVRARLQVPPDNDAAPAPSITAQRFDAAVTYAVIAVGLDPRAAGRTRYEIAIRVALTQLGLKVQGRDEV